MEIQSNYKQNLSILIHLLGWALFGLVIFILSPLSSGVERPFEFWLKQGINLSLLIAVFYINYFYFIPRVLFKNRIPLFLSINLLTGIACILFLILFDDWVNMQELMHKAYRPDVPYTPRPRNYYWDISQLLIFFMVIGISTSIASVQKWQADEAEKLEQKRQQINSELTYLKAQINPHFFFNTLNNIYSLTNIDVEKAKTALLKLSRMMRYVLYETEKTHTLLSKEIDFINDFIELMKMRLSSKVKLEITIPEKFQDAAIAPMLLLPFIENCFKHGVSSQKESMITIQIDISDHQLTLETSNGIFKSSENTPEGNASGIGLQNTKRRLALLYDHRYNLFIDDQNPENEFKVLLKIDLK
ncbi:sensor histidine kinase [Belliella pelovolcani]|jgi:two-component system, LytTR family, sensor kinase|uniref:Histidine kinase n=1 Tax=Belliella pelovolcani TaxID=529505 RepID=A0A1N7L4Q7_9BACT|nr:histidine kinase [Belliella pelovolcani]SIS68670.1 Histidine kinase [Belliella pelovolcani]